MKKDRGIKMGSVVKRILTVVSVLIVVTVFWNVEEVSANSWGDFDVRTKMPDNITADSMRKVYKKYGHSDSVLYEKLDWIIEEAESYGINPVYFVSKLNWESGWGKSNYSRNHNNFGGIGGSKAHTFETPEAGITANLQLLTKYVRGEMSAGSVTKGTKLTTPKKILEIYCPTSDGCNHTTYINGIGRMMEWFGQPLDGNIMAEGSGEVIEKAAENIKDAGGRKIPLEEIYIEDGKRAEGYNTGLDANKDMVGASKSSWFYTFSSNTQIWLFRVGWVMSAVLVGYMALYMMAYMVVARGLPVSKFFTEKMVRESEEAIGNGIKGMVGIGKRMLIVVVTIAIFGSGAYIQLMGLILGIISKII